MNNLEGWKEAREIVKRAWEHWKPHFEILYSEGNDKLRAFFLLDDTDVEWELHNKVPEEVKKDFSDYIQYAKEELLEKVGFQLEEQEEKLTESCAERASKRLSMRMQEYEAKTGLKLSLLVFNMLFYSEWLVLPEEILEKKFGI